jgi:hypothetical protein
MGLLSVESHLGISIRPSLGEKNCFRNVLRA